MKTIQLKPSCKDYLWGGEKLRTEYGIQSEMHPLSEAWMLSCHPDGPSYLPDGTTLQQYIDAHPGCLGTDCVKFEEFPILAKLIDAKKDLSIQVHPSNAYALEHEHQYGKTEMWYVLEAEPGATLYYGFTHEISKEEFEHRIKDNTLTEVLNAVPVKKATAYSSPPARSTPSARASWWLRFSRIPTSPTAFTIMAARVQTASPASSTSRRLWM